MRKLFFIFCFFVSPILIFAQESQAQTSEAINAESTDAQVFNMSIDLKIQDGVSAQEVSFHKAQHQTVTGRPVILNIKGDNFRGAVRFTLYNQHADNLMLLAQSTVAYITEGRRQVLSFAKSIPIKAGEKILFFPMGVLKNGENSGYSCKLEMEVSKYQQQQPGTQE